MEVAWGCLAAFGGRALGVSWVLGSAWLVGGRWSLGAGRVRMVWEAGVVVWLWGVVGGSPRLYQDLYGGYLLKTHLLSPCWVHRVYLIFVPGEEQPHSIIPQPLPSPSRQRMERTQTKKNKNSLRSGTIKR